MFIERNTETCSKFVSSDVENITCAHALGNFAGNRLINANFVALIKRAWKSFDQRKVFSEKNSAIIYISQKINETIGCAVGLLRCLLAKSDLIRFSGYGIFSKVLEYLCNLGQDSLTEQQEILLKTYNEDLEVRT